MSQLLVFKIKKRKDHCSVVLEHGQGIDLNNRYALEIAHGQEIALFKRRTKAGFLYYYKCEVRNLIAGVINIFCERGYFIVDDNVIKRLHDNPKLLCEKRDLPRTSNPRSKKVNASSSVVPNRTNPDITATHIAKHLPGKKTR